MSLRFPEDTVMTEVQGADDPVVRTIYFIGSPGAGKGTLCKQIARDLGWAHFSLGDELRSCVKNSSIQNHHLFDAYLQTGDLIPSKLLGPFLQDHFEKSKAKGHNVIMVDGFPRSITQLHDLVPAAIPVPDLVIFLNCPKDLAKRRFLTRAIEGRNDTEQLFEHRYLGFKQLNHPILALFQARGMLVEVDSSGTADHSYESLISILHDRGLLMSNLDTGTNGSAGQ